MLPCSNDSSLGPVTTCRSFDFTIAFESYILSVLPSALLLVAGAWQLWHLRGASYRLPTWAEGSRSARAAYLFKLATAGALVACDLAALVIWTSGKDEFSDTSLIVATVLALPASILGAFLSHREHFVLTSSSLCLPFYLLSTILCDIVRVRTFALAGFLHNVRDGRFFAVSCATLGARVLWFISENIDKGWILRQIETEPRSLESTATFVSRIFFAWAAPLLLSGARTKLTLDNLEPISEDLDSIMLWTHGRECWDKEIARGGKHPLMWTLLKAFPSSVLAPILPCIIYSLAMIARPVAIGDAINFIGSYTNAGATPQPVENGYGLAVAFFFMYAVYGVAYSWWFLAVNRGATMIRGFLLEAIYRKALRLHVEKAKETGSSKTGSMASIETEKVLQRFQTLYEPLSALIIIVIGLILLYKQIGAALVSTVIGVLIMAAVTPYLTKHVGPSQVAWTALTDRRTRLMSSILRNMMPVKLSAYTRPLGDKILAMRDEEMVACTRFWVQILKMSVLTNTASGMINLITLGTYAVVTIVNPSAPPLTTSRMFTVIATLSTILMPFFSLGQGWASLLSAWTAIKRIEEYLLCEEKLDEGQESQVSVSSDPEISFSGASFGRGNDVFLHDISTAIPPGQLTFVIGRVGSGKSTFLHACLGEVDLLAGSANVKRQPTAFCSQDSFLRNESIRDSIVFASPYDAAWYRKVIRATALERDFEIFPDGDMTVATRTSGGQRQRIALARAVYARTERLVLDDTFSALDANTEEAVFSALFDPISGLLKGHTVVLVTNGVHRLHRADKIIVLADGHIAEQGTYDDLIAAKGLTCDLIRDHASGPRRGKSAAAVAAAEEEEEAAEEEKESKAPTDDEGRRGGIGWPTYRFYFSAVGRWRLFLSSSITVVVTAMPVVINIYQSYWSSSIVENPRGGLKRFFGGYVCLELFYLAMFILAVWHIFTQSSPAAATKMHRILVNSVLAAPLAKLEQGGGSAKLQNRFTSDIFEIDFTLPNSVLNVTFLALEVLASTLVICVSAPWIALIIGVVAFIFVVIQRFYARTSQQLRRLDLGSKTPIYSLLSDTVNADGIRTLRAFQVEDFFRDLNTRTIGRSQKPYYLLNVTRRWMNQTVNLVVAIINFALVLIAVLERNATSAAIFAVALVQATLLTNTLNYLLLSWVELEIGIVAIERVKEMADLEPEESPELRRTLEGDEVELKKLKSVWPRQGGIVFNNVTARYDAHLEPVLRGVSFKVRAGDRVGIVGRTGSGKSTTLAVLFRMLEIDDGGSVTIDGRNTKHLSLDTLRQGLTLIPQDPLLLEMSLRDNLDLEGQCSDLDIWSALDKCSMKSVVEALPGKLDEVVTGSGRFSRGQKQLLALARALLRNRSIVCLDEATSSLDVETDQAIQRTLRSSFGSATIITIAHRIATIQDYDHILVLDQGKLAEQGSPADLMRIDGGLFKQLVKGHEESPTQEKEIQELS